MTEPRLRIGYTEGRYRVEVRGEDDSCELELLYLEGLEWKPIRERWHELPFEVAVDAASEIAELVRRVRESVR